MDPQQQQQQPPPQQQPPTPPPKDPRLKGVVGLQNMGNTCYANSTLQLLRAVPELNTLCLQPDLEERCVNKDSVPSRILLAYQDLLRSLWSAHRPAYVRPLGFLSIIRDNVAGTLYENFARPMQNDSHEYMVYLLDNFHEALNTRAKETPLSSPSGNPATPEEMRDLAARGWSAFTHRNQSPIVDQFFGMTRKTFECQGCKNKTYQWETFNVFKISSSGMTFDEWIRNEYTPETIEGFECIPCKEAEKGRQTLKIQSHIWQLPSTLFVGVKRFTPDGRKVMSPCPYNGTAVTFASYFAEESDHPSKSWSFECRAIADHHGGHLGGHYSAQFCHPITDDWWWLDDEMSQPMPRGPMFGPSTYVLFFRRKYDTERVAGGADAGASASAPEA